MQKKLVFTTLGNGPPLVLLHGWGFHSGIFQTISEQLAQHFQLILIDLPGHGRNHDSCFAEDIHTVANQVLEVAPENAYWLGWSLGGLLAQYIAIYYPSRIKKLLAVASSPNFLSDANWPGMELTTLQNFSRQLITDYESTLMNFLLLQFNDVVVNKSLIKWLKTTVFQYGTPNLKTLQNGLKILETVDLRQQMMTLSIPTLFMLGRLDMITPVELADALPQKNPNVQSHVFLKASHAPFLSVPDEFLTVLGSFLYD